MTHDDPSPADAVQEKSFVYFPFRQKSDTSEAGLESLIVRDMQTRGWLPGNSQDYDRGYCVDLAHLQSFVLATQPKLAEAFDLANDSPTRRQFLARLEKEIGARGVIDVLRRGIKHQAHDLTLFYATPSPDSV
jgi:type I restriction enzyme, R subunit